LTRLRSSAIMDTYIHVIREVRHGERQGGSEGGGTAVPRRSLEPPPGIGHRRPLSRASELLSTPGIWSRSSTRWFSPGPSRGPTPESATASAFGLSPPPRSTRRARLRSMPGGLPGLVPPPPPGPSSWHKQAHRRGGPPSCAITSKADPSARPAESRRGHRRSLRVRVPSPLDRAGAPPRAPTPKKVGGFQV